MSETVRSHCCRSLIQFAKQAGEFVECVTLPNLMQETTRKMKILLAALWLLAVVSIAAAQATPSQTPAPARTTPAVPHTTLKVGQPAPDFTLASTVAGPDGRSVRYKLSDFKGKKNVVLAFY